MYIPLCIIDGYLYTHQLNAHISGKGVQTDADNLSNYDIPLGSFFDMLKYLLVALRQKEIKKE